MSNIVAEIVGTPAAPAEEQSTAPVADEQPSTPAEQPPAEQPEQPDDSQFSSRFAALSRKEKHLQEQAAALKAQQEEIARYKELETSAKENPLELLSKYGLSLDDIISASLGDDAPAPTVESQIEKLRAEIEGYKTEQQKKEEEAIRQQKEAFQNSINEAIAAYQAQITDHLSENVEKYELINLQGAQDLVWEVAEAHYEATEEVLTPEDAAGKVEAYLEEQVKKAMNLSRFKAQPTTQETDSGSFNVEQARPTEKPKSHTLTSEYVQQAVPSEAPTGLSEEESKRRAASMIKWT